MAVTDTGGANAFFSNDLSHLLITEGNAIADKLEAHFMTSASSCQQKSEKFETLFRLYVSDEFIFLIILFYSRVLHAFLQSGMGKETGDRAGV